MNTIEIEVNSPIYSRILSGFALPFIHRILSYEKEYWRKGRHGMERNSYRAKFIQGNTFLTGFIPRIIEIAKTQELNVELKETIFNLLFSKPFLKEAELRQDQEFLIQKIIKNKRGLIVAPARTGKTVICAGLINAAPKEAKILFLAHTIDLILQTVDEFKRFGVEEVGELWGKKKEVDARVLVSTHQSFIKGRETVGNRKFDMVIVDEAHHIKTLNSNYGKILLNINAPYRIGFTATPEKTKEAEMTVEGLLGPIIGEVTLETAIELNIMAKPKLKILRAPVAPTISEAGTFSEAYEIGVINNRGRTRLIVNITKEYLEKGETVLILVKRIKHGFRLKEVFDLLLPQYEVPFICGGIDSDTQKEITKLQKKTDKKAKVELEELLTLRRKVQEMSDERSEYRKKLNKREIKCAIVTSIWNEGVNIPTLNVLINAAGGKSEINTIQMGSRSLTKTEGKEEGIIIDFFDSGYWKLIEHFGERISTYIEQGWL
jgi:superfamily II DNA or RNA helicase